MHRTTRFELLDTLDGSAFTPQELAENLTDIARLNRLTGTAAWISRAVFRVAPAGARRMTVLDIGAGGADIAIDLQRRAARRGVKVRIVAADRHPGVLRSFRRSVAAVRADAIRLPVSDGGVDVLICSHMLHHLTPGEVSAALCEFVRVTRWGFVLFDLERNRLAIPAVRLLTWAISRNRLTRYDGPVSIRRAYRRTEMQDLATQAGLNPNALTIVAAFPFRWLGLYRQALGKGTT